jgi:hypothetical protein
MPSVNGKQFNPKKIERSQKLINVVLLLGSTLLGVDLKAVAQVRPAPNLPTNGSFERLQIKANLQVTAKPQGNCIPLTFLISNTGGSSSGAFKINVISNTGEIVQTFLVADIKAKENRTFEYMHSMSGQYTIVVDPDKTVDELFKEDNTIKVETRCIK